MRQTEPSKTQKINGSTQLETRKKFASKAFNVSSHYDTAIFKYFNEEEVAFKQSVRENKVLRYGENPHQSAGLYISHKKNGSLANAKIHQGKELSYNNFLDTDTAMNCVMEFDDPACVIVKHVNPCGVAIGVDLNNAYEKSFETDPESAFGGVIAVNGCVDKRFASTLIENQFVEVLIAPDFSKDALDALKEKKNIRVISKKKFEKSSMPYSIQAIDGGFLVQEDDWKIIDKDDLEYVTDRKPNNDQILDLLFAWKVVKQVKSNGIVFVKNEATVGIGSGQPSRLDSTITAINKSDKLKAKQPLKGTAMASDAFFPFADSLKEAVSKGVKSVIQPGGSIRDKEVIDFANKKGISMVFTGIRAFKH